MALLGTAALAMWWDMAPALRGEFEHWHSHEHFPERLALPGFRRGSRWGSATGGTGIFVLYELEAHEVLASPAYLARLNAPTPWSQEMMPHHANMVRCQSRVVHSRGGAVAGSALTVRLSFAAGREEALRTSLCTLLDEFVQRPGITGAHLLETQAPAIAQTVEQRIRGGADRAADATLLVTGYDGATLAALAAGELSAAALQHVGAEDAVHGLHALLLTMVPADVS